MIEKATQLFKIQGIFVSLLTVMLEIISFSQYQCIRYFLNFIEVLDQYTEDELRKENCNCYHCFMGLKIYLQKDFFCMKIFSYKTKVACG
ncbi:hypothetical protein PORY_002752 [Pneumocystis oryctolagi]|uniref:Uncharacterized protein n=1 Tax=Pneumocystis oryctolagi TaxID=42067 RepID=A0ACB7C9X4_9ASCO|nr:hypothetical protein PORY_002752 [Pneumocystis oryctolagi]